jgi:6-phosphofructokinase 1
MTANTLHRFQDTLPVSAGRIRIVHVPKTIDNDYSGIDFTFGFFTAVDVMSKSLLNLRADAIATRSYFVVEVMGRTAGWLGYGVSIAGEAHMVIGVEDVVGDLVDEDAGPRPGTVPVYLDLDALCDRIQRLIQVREAQGKLYGVVVLTEGLVELLPPHVLAGLPRNEHGMISLARMNIGKLVAERTSQRLREQGRPKKVTGVQLGYEARCAMPHAFDVVLGCQLGRGTWRALEEEDADACMVSMTGQMQHRLIPFAELVDSLTLQTTTRLIDPRSDFHRLAHGLATRLDP